MSSYIVTFKADATDAEVQEVKDDVVAKGGTVEHEYSLIKGFSFKTPEVSGFSVDTLSAHPNVETVEADQEMRTQ
ncbi:peptidase inhibitor I9 [Parachaetomium inaequale]|uniref:Peptidase inhibitor I9 n=1 Tax=Parachaetomium inaequale TaxID=2588326 RepID=A0AAN6PM47_9PEZI|nr:peptidase inhibitor I9 [Parachaetomium inaequale]